MSFGKKKSSSNDKKVQQALTPANFYSPFGNVVDGTFTPVESADQIATRQGTDQRIRQLISSLPGQLNVSDLYNNPFYQTTYDLTKRPIDLQRGQDFKELNNELSARNQLGSSYDAYRRYLTDQRYDQAYRQAENSARLSSADAYSQSLNQSLAMLQGLRNNQNAYMDALYTPAKLALNYQQASSPLQTTLANYYNNQATQQQNYNNQSQIQQQLALASLIAGQAI